jgi:hypothetical protein
MTSKFIFEVIVTNLDLHSTSKNSLNLLNGFNCIIAHLYEYSALHYIAECPFECV